MLIPQTIFLWGYLKDKLYTSPPINTDELIKECYYRKMQQMNLSTFLVVIENCPHIPAMHLLLVHYQDTVIWMSHVTDVRTDDPL